MAPTPQLIWRIPQNMELMDRRRAVWIPLGRHPHRYLGRAIIGGSIHGNGIVLDHRSRLRSDEQELNSPQRLRFCSVLWSWSWLVCSRAPGKRSGDQICSDFRFWGIFRADLLGAVIKGFLPLNRKSCCRVCLPVRRVVASYVTGAVTARSRTFQLLRPAVLRPRCRAGWQLRSENSSKISHLSFWLNGDLMAYSWWQIRASLNGGGGYWAMN